MCITPQRRGSLSNGCKMKAQLKLGVFAVVALCAAVFSGCETSKDASAPAPNIFPDINTNAAVKTNPVAQVPVTRANAVPAPAAPYPRSKVLRSVTWHWDTHKIAALGSDLWPTTWGADDNIYASWGDGGGFGGSDSLGRVSLGFARIEGGPENYRGFNVNGGLNPEHPAMFPKKGKASGMLAVGGTLYANVNLQDGKWPDIHHQIISSTDGGGSWTRASWIFSKGPGQFQPTKFVNFDRGYTGVPANLAGYVYLYGFKQPVQGEQVTRMYFARVPQSKILDQFAYEFFQGADGKNRPQWKSDFATAQPVFIDPNGVSHCTVVYDPPLHRYISTSFHEGPGQLGIFDAPEPWGPWTTVAYYENWGDMGKVGEGLSCEFPRKWMSADGLTMWSIFAVYGEGGKIGVKAHDKFNLVKVTIERAPRN